MTSTLTDAQLARIRERDEFESLLREFGDSRESACAAYDSGDALTMKEMGKQATEARHEIMRRFDSLRASHERLERALHKHGVHLKHCRHFNLKVPHSVCTCGLDAAFYPGSES